MLLERRWNTRQDYEDRLLVVLRHIQGHLDGPGSLSELAELAHFSPFHFHRIFRAMVGENVGEYIRRLRLERAAQALTTGGDPVLTIALQAGYDFHEAFTRAFGLAYGRSPSAFRREPRETDLPSATNLHYQSSAAAVVFVPLTILSGGAMDVRIETIEPIRVAYLGATGPYGSTFPPLWNRLNDYAARKGLDRAETVRLSVPRDDPRCTDPDELRGEACISVPGDFVPDEGVQVQTIPGGKYAVARFAGPREGLYQAWCDLCAQWIPANGHQPRAAPCFELNRNESAAPLTEIYEPIA